ncbi:heptaprenyl diphosphate synthase component 1 [Cytobacillus sp. IB215665]|uniref:heptaprenyl diphosphate synthase component 1 n=1 Tax=Cytobacillus sp. IB215665 TaxID=3097357 RepID=UPI002A16A14C|nr:heptaprenyl diphosphate synthase component 1 [Cytobacillus sp. IB215665]MDX8364849.1 heptaprenyl diphosphate synthase component 1 [Cytobacillus sp. IB215665]
MEDIWGKIALFKEDITDRIHYPFLFKHIHTPVIDEDKMLLLYSVLQELELSNETVSEYMIAIMLVQISLDTHDTVTNVEENNSGQLTERQLTILAGDYYSGLYYKILSQAGDISLISTVASAIKMINEHKIKLYENKLDSLEELMNSLKVVESSLFQNVSEFFGKPFWKEISAHFLLFKRLLIERKKFLNNEHSLFFDSCKRVIFQLNNKDIHDKRDGIKSQLIHMCETQIIQTKNLIDRGLEGNPIIKHIMANRIEQLMYENFFTVKKIVEEG